MLQGVKYEDWLEVIKADVELMGFEFVKFRPAYAFVEIDENDMCKVTGIIRENLNHQIPFFLSSSVLCDIPKPIASPEYFWLTRE